MVFEALHSTYHSYFRGHSISVSVILSSGVPLDLLKGAVRCEEVGEVLGDKQIN